jgi:diamine N-acetyltransferase
LAWRNRDEVRVWFKTREPLVPESHRAWFESYVRRDNDFLFIIEESGRAVGQASVYKVDWKKREAEVGRFVRDPDAAGRGLMREACAELLGFCATRFQLVYVYLEVFAENKRATAFYQRLDFVEERRYDGLIRMGRKLAGCRSREEPG